jgi:hypothetical protein
MLNPRIRILLHRLIFAQVICKLHFIDLQHFLYKFPNIGFCQKSDELLLKLHRTCKIPFNTVLPYMSVARALFTPYYPFKFCICCSFLLCVVLAGFLDLLECKWLMLVLFFYCRADCCRYGGLSVAMQKFCCQLYDKQSGHKKY